MRSAYWFVSEKGGFAQVGYHLDQARLDRFREVLDVVVDGIEDGHFPAHPGERNFFSFENCARIANTSRSAHAIVIMSGSASAWRPNCFLRASGRRWR